ncbi:hypothetical protein AB0A74_15295 [Saccharothrix sp. NPDC042600]|uniref:hypothetical protein n=1 Tax=Saccharothrix TaxID=2071 RepID=UPI0033C962EA
MGTTGVEINEVSGDVHGPALQIHTLHGDVHLAGPGGPAAPARPAGRAISGLRLRLIGLRTAPHDAVVGDRGALPAYVERPFTQVLHAAVARVRRGESALVVLVSDSSSGKTRAAYESLLHRPEGAEANLVEAGWRMWPALHYADPATMVAEVPSIAPRTVVWLDEAQRYLLDPPPEVRDRLCAGLHALLADPDRGPVLVLATLWQEYWETLTRRPVRGERDGHAAARALLLDGEVVRVPSTFTELDRRAAEATGDPELLEAVRRTEDGAITQYLAAVPDLLRRVDTAGAGQLAVVHAAMDARRLGHGEWMPAAFLHDAAFSYLSERERRALRADRGWFTAALSELARLGDGHSFVLERHPDDDHVGPVAARYRLEDYHDQVGRRTRGAICPRQVFWDALLEHASSPAELSALAESAKLRQRLHLAHQLLTKASASGHSQAFSELSWLHHLIGSQAEAERYAHAAVDHPGALCELVSADVSRDPERTERLYRASAAAGETESLQLLGWEYEQQGRWAEAEEAYTAALEAGWGDAAASLGMLRESMGDSAAAERLYHVGVARGSADAADELSRMRLDTGDWLGAEHYALVAVRLEPYHNERYLELLVERRCRGGELGDAERLARAAVEVSGVEGLVVLARLREKAGEGSAAESIAQDALQAGSPQGYRELIRLRAPGDVDTAERLALTAASAGHAAGFEELARARASVGDAAGAERFARAAADAGGWRSLRDLAVERSEDDPGWLDIVRYGLTADGDTAKAWWDSDDPATTPPFARVHLSGPRR